MSDPVRANIYTIPAHRGFSDALVTGLIARFRDEATGLARLTLILPNSRARQAVTEAFVRQSGAGLLLPRMVVIGDLDLGESLGALLDPLGSGADVPPAADPLWRQLMLARFIRAHDGSPLRRDEQHRSVRQDVRLACQMGQTIDELLIARIDPASVVNLPIAEELAKHWQTSLQLFDAVWRDWQAALAKAGRVDAAERRNRLLDHAARRWQANPPAQPVIAAGISTAAPAIADLLRVIALSPKGMVVLPDLDQELDSDIWDNLGRAGIADGPDKEPFGPAEAYAHPQYHLKLLLGRMGVARDEVRRWHRSGTSDAPPARSRAISNVFLPAQHSRIWQHLKPDQRRLGPVRLMECDNPAEEAQAIALLIRQRLDVPEQRIALVTPDRQLAERVAAHLARWNIMADDSGGRALSLSAPGALVLCLADALADPGAPVPLMAVLKHPLTRAGEGRLAWLDKARRLDLLLRGPRLSVGFGAIRQALALDAKRREQRDLAPDLDEWWNPVEAALSALPPRDVAGDSALADMIAGLVQAAEFFAGTAIWRGQEGRALADRLQALAEQGRATGFALPPAQFAALMRSWLDEVAVRPAYGTHPRVAIYGLLEARLQQADLVICAGLNEGVWPQRPSPDPVIAPRMARSLGLASPEFRIGLSAHDLAGALGAPETVLTRAKRDMSGPTIASRFLLRIQAMLGPDLPRETAMPDLARRIDLAPPAAPYKQPKPMPPAHVRRVAVSATQLDRLRADPYTFYADKILGLRALDPLDALPGPAWRGTMIHAIIERWQRQGDDDPASLRAMAEAQLRAMGAHPLLRVLAGPRLFAGLDWLAEHHAALKTEGRLPLGYEVSGYMDVDGITLKGKADRIDALADGGLAIIDFKTGSPPSNAMVQAGFALQLGLLGLIARHDGFRNRHDGTQIQGEAQAFEYWTLKKRTKGDGFGYVTEPFRKAEDKPGMPREEFIDKSETFLRESIARWLNGDDPFTARLNPDLPGYGDYDQLMRLEEWFGRASGAPLNEAGQ